MDLNDAHDFIKEHAHLGMKRVLEGTSDSYTTPCLCLEDATSILMELGAISLEDMDTNGWEWDFWENWTFGDKKFQLSGSGFYGRIKFTKSIK